MNLKTLFITPPFTQLNTPYPATTYLTGYLRSIGYPCDQCDLSIELFNAIFTSQIIEEVFYIAEEQGSIEYKEVYDHRDQYIQKVDMVIAYLRHQEEQTAKFLIMDGFLPTAHRSAKRALEYESLSIIDKAKHLGTLFIEELGDFITANIDEFFAFTRYAESIARSASSFDTIDSYLQYEPTLIEEIMLEILDEKIKRHQPKLIAFTVPFPGNLFSALRCAQFIKYEYPHIKVAMGGGYCNTELRSLSDSRIFDYVDYISLDDGEIPLRKIIDHVAGEIPADQLERTFILKNGKVTCQNHTPNTIIHHKNLPAPTYQGLDLNAYLSFLDVINPMHRMWTDGRWNKLTIAHGCYWKQCSFCDVSLDYIGNYQNTTAKNLVDKMEILMQETGFNGFHFVDEAAPPKDMKALAEEIIARGLKVQWWTNIRFEKTFTSELCELLARSGCIAVTGGLEVASDRLLTMMKKGVDIEQVRRVTKAFTDNGILVHAYLMYGFPTQTEQETIDALDVVRNLFKDNCIQSAFWHLFTATAHSPIGLNPAAFDIEITGPKFEGFAENDLFHKDPKGADHQKFTKGLNLALAHYMAGEEFDKPAEKWFE